MGRYDAVTASAYLQVQDHIRGFKMEITAGCIDLSNLILHAAEKDARRLTPVRRKPYPPSRERVPGQMRRSIRVIEATESHPGKILIHTWLWEWIEGWKARDAAHRAANGGKGIKYHRNVGRGNKSLSRFQGMVRTDPRRLIGEPVERQIGFAKSEKRLVRVIDRAIQKNAVSGDILAIHADMASRFPRFYDNTPPSYYRPLSEVL